MVIKLDILAKQGVLIAVLSIAELIFLLVDGLWEIIYYHEKPNYKILAEYAEAYDEININFEGENVAYLKELAGPGETQRIIGFGFLISYVVGIFVSALMIFGILKKHKTLLVPWIVTYGLCAVVAICYLIYSLFAGATTTTSLVRAVEVFNIACLALYPVTMLFRQMHREASEKKNLQCQIESQAADVGIHPKFNPYFVGTLQKKVETEI